VRRAIVAGRQALRRLRAARQPLLRRADPVTASEHAQLDQPASQAHLSAMNVP